MSWLHKTVSSCGRHVAKPEKPGKAEELNDEAIPLQDQIENLRAKISLKGIEWHKCMDYEKTRKTINN